jgi:hypothetical protein
MMKKNLILLGLLLSVFYFGQVGINTPSPSAALDIVSKGSDGTTKALEINNSATPTPKEMMTVLNNNNVGIGVSNPAYNFEIGDFLNNGSYLSLSQTGSNANGQSSLTYFTKRDNSNSLTSATSKGWKWFALSDAYTSNPALANSLFLEGWNNGVRTQNVLVANPNGNIGFGIQSPTARVHINVSSPGTGFRLVDGSQGAGKTLVSDANGNAQWNTASSTFVGLRAYNSATRTVAANTPFQFDTLDYNNGAGTWDGTTWTVASSGYYMVTARVWVETVPTGGTENVSININGNLFIFGTQSSNSPYVSGVVKLNANDQVTFASQFGSTEQTGSPNDYVSVHKIGN